AHPRSHQRSATHTLQGFAGQPPRHDRETPALAGQRPPCHHHRWPTPKYVFERCHCPTPVPDQRSADQGLQPHQRSPHPEILRSPHSPPQVVPPVGNRPPPRQRKL